MSKVKERNRCRFCSRRCAFVVCDRCMSKMVKSTSGAREGRERDDKSNNYKGASRNNRMHGTHNQRLPPSRDWPNLYQDRTAVSPVSNNGYRGMVRIAKEE